jgi:sarcosine oxidase subunit beta
MRASCDILLIGGGVVGASIAYHLARRRAGRIVLVEKSFLGAGASGKAGVILRRRDDSDAVASLAHYSQRVYEHFAESIGGPPIFSRTGLVLLPSGVAATPGLRPISSLESMEIDPNLHLLEGETALYDPGAGTVDPVQVLAQLAEEARRQGVDLRQGVEVRSLLVEKGKAIGVDTNEGPYACGAVVLAVGAWTTALARGLKTALPVRACRSQTALFRRPLDLARRAVICIDQVQGLYFKPAPGEAVEAGNLTVESDTEVDPDQYDEAADGEWLRSVRPRLSRRFPALHRSYGRGGYGALCAATPDGAPILDRLPGVEGLWCAAGFGGQDVALAPAAGRLLSEMMLGGKADDLDAAPFRLARFSREEEPKAAPATNMGHG